MFRIVKLLFVFFLFFIASTGYAQPNACTTLPTGVFPGGDFDFNPASGALCLPTGTLASIAGVTNKTDVTLPPGTVSNIFYVFETPATTDYNTLRFSPQFIPAVAGSASHTYTSGSYWVLQSIQVNSTTYVKCKEFFVVAKNEPKVNISLCGNSSVIVEIPIHSKNNDTQYEINWGDGSPIEIIDVAVTPLPVTKPHTYSVTPIPMVSVLGRYIKNGTELCPGTPPASGIPQPLLTPFIYRLESTNNGAEALINFQGHTSGHSYDIMAKPDGGVFPWAVVGTATNGSATVTGLTANQKYCFKLSTVDDCGTPINSNEVCSIVLNAVPASSTTANLTWNIPSSPVGIPTRTEYWRNSTLGLNSGVLSPVATSYSDNTLSCSNQYEYQIQVDYNVLLGNVTIFSNKMVVDPSTVGTSTAPSNVLVVGYDPTLINTIKVNVHVDPNKPALNATEYRYFRSDGGGLGVFNLVKSSVSNELFDVVTNTTQQYCYKYQYKNTCGVWSNLSDSYCTIILSTPTGSNLDWTKYIVSASAITTALSYPVYVLDGVNPALQVGLSYTENFSIQALIDAATTPKIDFQILGVQKATIDGSSYNFQSYSNTVSYIFPIRVFLPTAFTPNVGDVLNDKFYPTFNKNIVPDANMNMQVFDRWGSLVFDSASAGTYKWDGKINGVDAPVGTYAYTVSGESVLAIPFSQSGTFMLLR